MRHIPCLLLLLLSVLTSSVYAASPARINAAYDILKAGIRIGEIEESYLRDGDRYTLTSTTRATGLLSWFRPGKMVVRSSGLIDAQGLRPETASVTHERNEKDNRRAELDWVNRKLTLIGHKEHKVVDLPAITLDRLSAMYQFMFLPLQEPALEFQMVNGNYLLRFRFDVSKGPVVKTPVGEHATLYLDNLAQKARERTELWLVPQLYNLPVKMVVTDDSGGKITQVLRKLDITP